MTRAAWEGDEQACGAGAYVSVAGTSVSDVTCAACSGACAAGTHYESRACTAGTATSAGADDRVCTVYTVNISDMVEDFVLETF